MPTKALEDIERIHRHLTQQGFSSQFMGSMIEYRLAKKPEVSVALQIKEHPYRKPREHGLLLYRVINSSFLQPDAIKEQAQEVVYSMVQKGFVLEQTMDLADLKDALESQTLKELRRVFAAHENTRQAFKALLHDVHGFLTDGKHNPHVAVLAPKTGRK